MSQGGKYNFDALASILTSIDNMSDKILKYQKEKIDLALNFARSIDKIKSGLENGLKLKAEDIINAILSSPSQDDMEFITRVVRLFRQMDNDLDPELTDKFLSDVRDAFFIRKAKHAILWDDDIRGLLKMLMVIGSNVNTLFKKAIGDNEGGAAAPTDEESKKEKKGSKAEHYKLK